MTRIVILGAGVMGSALAVPPASIGSNRVTLAGSPLDDDIIQSIVQNRHHPALNAPIPESVDAVSSSKLQTTTLQAADVIVIGVSSAGIDWVTDYLKDREINPPILALVTKGLVKNNNVALAPVTYADALTDRLPVNAKQIVGIGGPCIAQELALGYPTRVTFACRDQTLADRMRDSFQTDYYRITTHSDIVSVEACAALKNFLCIGVSAMLRAYTLADSHAKNPVAALYNQAVHELFTLSQWIAHASAEANGSISVSQGKPGHPVAFDLAGMGDLHVTVGGGRNSRLGGYLGTGDKLSHILETSMKDVTVEGVDTGRSILASFRAACKSGDLNPATLPLTASILDAIENNSPFNFDFMQLPG